MIVSGYKISSWKIISPPKKYLLQGQYRNQYSATSFKNLQQQTSLFLFIASAHQHGSTKESLITCKNRHLKTAITFSYCTLALYLQVATKKKAEGIFQLLGKQFWVLLFSAAAVNTSQLDVLIFGQFWRPMWTRDEEADGETE